MYKLLVESIYLTFYINFYIFNTRTTERSYFYQTGQNDWSLNNM